MNQSNKTPKHLTINTASSYQGLSVNNNHGMVVQYLDRTKIVLDNALQQFPRTLVINFGLSFPQSWEGSCVHADVINRSISLFFKNFEREVDKVLAERRGQGKRVHPNCIRYVWARERGSSLNPHYHVAIFLNADCFRGTGAYDLASNSIASSIQIAWNKALYLDSFLSYGLVHFPQNSEYRVDSNSMLYPKQYGDVINRLSYYCKITTKEYSSAHRNFGYSLK
ncbi:inovirus Gp2 family protein [Pseudoalteromonas sp. T1lg75]|uniref:inovirus Gp2 family protein n=1 Tax=Pseudoalteromonas sp. T1lg75 TaxID=2077102 RepID=UPI000CF6BDCC|nr:inovirus Gp2 family protein [Pseudoalteromonas sp. T1lg75]